MLPRTIAVALVGAAVSCDQFPSTPPGATLDAVAGVDGGDAGAAGAGAGGLGGAGVGGASGAAGMGGDLTVVVSVAAGSDDVNEDDEFDGSSSTVWLGTGKSVNDSYTGLRFQSVGVPAGATVLAAVLEVLASEQAWTSIEMELGAQAADSCGGYSNGQRPSKRALTAARVAHSSNEAWQSGTWYAVADLAGPVGEVIARAGWKPGNALCVIGHGTGSPYGRKQVTSFEGSNADSARLRITYRGP